jgi:hypothetical protein
MIAAVLTRGDENLKHISSLAAMQLLLVHILAACSPAMSVEQQVITVIRDMEEHIEAGERRPFMEYVSAEFAGQNRAMTRDQLNALVLYQLHQHQRVHAQLFPIQVTTGIPGEAEARFSALLTGGRGWLPDNGQVYEFITRWRHQDDKWVLISAQWKPGTIDQGL